MIDKQILEKKEELRRAQENIHSVADVVNESRIRDQLEELLNREELMWSQKARKNWDIQGDRNTKFYQTVVWNRRRKNKITRIKNQDNTWISEPQAVKQHFADHFK